MSRIRPKPRSGSIILSANPNIPISLGGASPSTTHLNLVPTASCSPLRPRRTTTYAPKAQRMSSDGVTTLANKDRLSSNASPRLTASSREINDEEDVEDEGDVEDVRSNSGVEEEDEIADQHVVIDGVMTGAEIRKMREKNEEDLDRTFYNIDRDSASRIVKIPQVPEMEANQSDQPQNIYETVNLIDEVMSLSSREPESPIPNPIPKSPEMVEPEQIAQESIEQTKVDDKEYVDFIDESWLIDPDDLELDTQLSSGEEGEVYLGYYFGTPVAIKKLFVSLSQSEAIKREASLLSNLRHPNIVQYLGLSVHKSNVYMVSEYVEHGDLVDLLMFSSEQLPWDVKVKISLQIAQALFYMHSKNVIHRDIKGLNVLVGDNYKVKICDFGLATSIENGARLKAAVGTNFWIAPEILLGKEYGPEVDVFSFGVVLVEIITQSAPIKRLEENYAFHIERFKSIVPENCPPAFSELVENCTQLDPSKRPKFRDICKTLKSLLQELE